MSKPWEQNYGPDTGEKLPWERSYGEAPPKPKENGYSAGKAMADTAVSAAQGTTGLIGAGGALLDSATGGRVSKALAPAESAARRLMGLDSAPKGIAGSAAEASAALQPMKSDELQKSEQELANTEGFLPSAAQVITDPKLLLSQVGQQLPILAATMKGARSGAAAGAAEAEAAIAARGAAGRAPSAAAAERLTRMASARGAERAVLGTTTAMGGGFSAQQAIDDVMAMPEETLQGDPEYAALLGEGYTPAEARQLRAYAAGRTAAPIGAVANLAAGRLTSGIEARAFTGRVAPAGARGLLSADGARGVAGAVGREALEETITEGAETFGGNVGVSQVDPTQSLWEGVPEAAGAAGVMGGVIGGGVQVGGALTSRPGQQRGATGEPEGARAAADALATAPQAQEVVDVDPAAGPLSKAVATDAAEQAGSPVVGPVRVTTPVARAADVEAAAQQGASKATPAAVAENATTPAVKESLTAPAGMNPETGEIAAPASDAQIRAALDQRAGTIIDAQAIRGIAASLGVPVNRVALARRAMRSEERAPTAAPTTQQESRNADEAPREPDGRPDAGRDQRSAPAQAAEGQGQQEGQRQEEARREESAGAVRVDGRQEGARQEAGEYAPDGARGARGGRVLLTVDQSAEQLDDDILTPSGAPFSIRGAAEMAARRAGGGAQVVELEDGGFVVRTPKEVPSETGSDVAQGRDQSQPRAQADAVDDGQPGTAAPPVAPASGNDRSDGGEVAAEPKAASADADQRQPGAGLPEGWDRSLKAARAAAVAVGVPWQGKGLSNLVGEVKAARGKTAGESAGDDRQFQTVSVGKAKLKGGTVWEVQVRGPSGKTVSGEGPTRDAAEKDAIRRARDADAKAARAAKPARPRAGEPSEAAPSGEQSAQRSPSAPASEPAAVQGSEAGERASSAPVDKSVEDSPRNGEQRVNEAQKREEKRKAADVVFAANREAIKREGFKKGEEVEFTVPGPFTNDDGTVDQERVYRGTIGNLGDKEQAVVRVDVPGRRGVADYHVPATRLRRPKAAAAPTEEDIAAIAWRNAKLIERREMLREVGYDTDQARVFSGTDWWQLSDSVRTNLSKAQGVKTFAALNDSPVERVAPRAGKNTLFTAEAADAARKLLKSKLSQLNSGVDPEVLQAGITLAGYHIERGARTFGAYARAMVADMGDAVRPYLKSWYMGVKYDPRAATFEGMDSAAAVDAADVENLGDRRQDTAARAAVDAAEDPQAEISRLRAERDALQRQVDTDTLTSTKSREAYRRDNPGAKGVAFIDLIAFKGYNTKFTETGGDAILAEFGKIMVEVAGGAAYRRGGDEFAILSDQSPEHAAELVAKLQEAMDKVVVEMTDKNGDAYEVIGIPFRTGTGASDEQAVADNARRKEAGGDRESNPNARRKQPNADDVGQASAGTAGGDGVQQGDVAPQASPDEPVPVDVTTEADSLDPSTVAGQDDIMARADSGDVTLDELRAGFDALIQGRDAITAELSKLTKSQLLERHRGFNRPADKKGALVEDAFRQMVTAYNFLEGALSIPIVPGSDYTLGYIKAVRAVMDRTTDEALKKHAKVVAKARAARAERSQKAAAAIADPKTYEDFAAYINSKRAEGMTFRQARETLNIDQRIQLDKLMAEKSRGDRKAKKTERKTEIRAASQFTAGEIIEAKHTKKGHDLFVVQLAERLSTEDYRTVETAARRLGGRYSAYRGNGAVPGFQFTTRPSAEAFLALVAGDTDSAKEAAKARRDAFEDDRAQSAVDRLREMAGKLDERASEELGRDRKANTARRARFAAAAEASANSDKALAATMRNIAGSIESGDASMLDQVRTKSQVEFLRSALARAKGAQMESKYPTWAERERNQGEQPDSETVEFAEWPAYTLFRSDWAQLGRQLYNTLGSKLLGKKILKLADDVTAAYLKFAKVPANFLSLSRFTTSSGERPKFTTEADAESAILRSGFPGRAIPFKVGRGDYTIIMAPKEARERGLWSGDDDQRITIPSDLGAEVVEKIGKANRRASRGDKISVPWALEAAHDRLGALERMGIETPAEYRTALREFQSLREAPKAEDRIKKLEREMVGRKNDGLDFFPTPRAVVDDMLAAAEIEPEMSVLEPSAGMGHIAEAIREAGVEPDVIELGSDRRELLEAKGFNVVANDFMAMEGSPYDRIVMNPPFSDRRDAQHVRHAFDKLKPGGRLVAIMGEGVFFGQDKKAREFRDWLESVGGSSETLPEGSFMDPSLPVNTGVRARMVVVDKPEASGGAQSRPEPERPRDPRQFIVGPIDLQRRVDRTMARWRGDIPIVRVVESASQLPNPARLETGWEKAEGWYDGRGTIYLVSNNIANLTRGDQVLAHEAFGHYGVEGVVGKEQWAQIIKDVAKLRKDGAKMPAAMKAAMASTERRYGTQNSATFAREFLAVMAERGVQSGLMGRVLGAVRRWLRALGFKTDRWAAEEVREIVAKGMRQVRDPGAGPRPGSGRGTAMSAPARARTDTPAFKAWFGDSKVVDANGDPLVVYHGTNANFEAFKPGAYFTASQKQADQYARNQAEGGGSARLIPAYLSLRNPKIVSDDYIEWAGMEAGERAKLQAQGFDGMMNNAKTEIVAFRPEQIKSVDNSGAFNPSDARMAFSLQDPNAAADAIVSGFKEPGNGIVDRIKGKLEDWKPATLGLLTLRQLAEVADSYLPEGSAYVDLMTRMATRRNVLQAESADVAQKWEKMQRDDRRKATAAEKAARTTASDRTVDLMHDATLAGTDPAEAYRVSFIRLTHNGDVVSLDAESGAAAIARIESKLADKAWAKTAPDAVQNTMRGDIARIRTGMETEAARAAAHPALVRRWNALPPAWQALYREVRDSYSDRAKAFQDAMLAQVEALEIAERDKAALRTRIRNHFEAARVEAPYFPLARFGEFWASVEKTDKKGSTERQFIMAESQRDRDQMIAEAEREGWKLAKKGRKIENIRAQDGASGAFVADVIDTLGAAGVGEKVQDAVYQLYLRTLPDLSTRKQFIHRKKVAGYDADALRAFAGQMNHGAHQLARLEFGQKMADTVTALEKSAKALQDEASDDADRASAAVNEFKRRHDWVMNPTNANWVSAVSAFNFVFYLGVSPAAAAVNLTQTAIISYPALAARYGWGKALAMTTAAMRDTIRTGGNIQKTLANDDERRAYQQLVDMGAIDVTQAHDLAGLGDNPTQDYNARLHRAMNAVSFLFHKAEVFNREATGMAAYRLAREAGESHADALKRAEDTIWQTHYDYSNANRARFMQGNAAKVLFAFKQYSQNTTYYLWRAFYQSYYQDIKGALGGTKTFTKQEIKEARNRLNGTLGMTALFSGAMGLPLMSMMFGIANAMAALFGDDDEPWDAETEFRNFLADILPPAAARIVTGGAVEGGLEALGLTAPEIGSRTSLNDLWFRAPNQEMEGRDLWHYILEQIAGPVGGIFGGGIAGADMIGKGLATGNMDHVWRGFESMMPKAARDVMKFIRYEANGVETLRGDKLIEDTGVTEGIYQLMGFAPAQVAEQYTINSAVKGYEEKIMGRRQVLVDAYALAMTERDPEALRAAAGKIRDFNRANPTVAVTVATLRRSLASRAAYSEKAVNGIVVNPKLRGTLREKVRFATGGDDESED